MEKTNNKISVSKATSIGSKEEVKEKKKLPDKQAVLIQKFSSELKERTKQLTFHNQLTELLDSPSLPAEKIFQEIVNILPEAFQFPEMAFAYLRVRETVFTTKGFRDSGPFISVQLNDKALVFGELKVCYVQDKGEDPAVKFLREEIDLIRAAAQRLSNYCRQAEGLKALAESRDTYLKLIESVRDVIYEVSADGTITYISPAVSNFSGYPATHFIGKKLTDFFNKKDNTLFSGTMRKLYRGESIVIEHPFYNKNGSTLWTRLSAFPQMINGVLNSFSGTISDLSERREADRRIQRQNLFQEMLIKLSSEFNNLTADRIDTAINNSLRELGEFIGADRSYLFSYDFTKQTHTNTYEWCAEGVSPQMQNLIDVPLDLISEQVDLHLRGESNYIADVMAMNPGSKFREVLSAQDIKSTLSVPVMTGPHCTGFLGLDFVKDYYHYSNAENILLKVFAQLIESVTHRLKYEADLSLSESRLMSIIEHSRTVIWEVGLDGLYTYVSPVCESVWGYTSEELVGKVYFYDLHPENIRELFKETGMQMIRNRQSITAFVNPIVRKDGVVIWVSTNGVPVYNSKNEFIGYRGSDNDITERRVAEEALRRSEEKLNYAQKIARMGSWEYDARTGSTNWSKNYYNLLGIDPLTAPLSFAEFKKMIHTDDADLFEMNLALMYESKNLKTFTFRLLMKSGSVKWIQANMVPVYEVDRLVSISGVSIDITDKKEAEEEIRNQRERLKAIMEAMPDLIFVISSSGVISEYYTSSYNKLVIPAELIIGSDVRNIFDEKVSELQIQKISECLKTKSLTTFEYSATIRDVPNLFEARMVPIGESDVLAFVTDITDRKYAENQVRRLTLAMERSPVAIITTDLAGNIDYVSPAFTTIYGYTRGEILGKSTRMLKSGLTDPGLYKNLWDTVSAGKIFETEWINKRKNGETFWEATAVSPIRDDSGEITGYLSIKQDICRRKKAEQEVADLNTNLEIKITERTKELARARVEAEEANMAKSEFLSRISHELRTPLHSILGFAQLLDMGTLTPGQKKQVSKIKHSGTDLLELIDQVLKITRIDTGEVTLSPESIEVFPLITESINSVTPQANAKKITIEQQDADENIRTLVITSDRKNLRQILQHLLTNAIRYNKEEGSVILKSAIFAADENAGPRLRISITDTGIGISEKDLPKLFTPFERLGADKRDSDGIGLGLSVVKKLIALMDGQIGVESKLGEGSTFWFQLPLKTAAVKD